MPVLIALFHDILITAGVYALTGKEVSSGTVAAFLTILGYSLYDTIIVFDRVRENIPRMPRAAFSQIVNRSMSEVLTRSLATSFSTLLAVVSLLIFGGATLQDFAFAMIIGIASGTYSSIFIASPVLTAWKEREPSFARRRQRIAEVEGGMVPAYADDRDIARLASDDELEGGADSRHTPDSPAAEAQRGAVATVERTEDPLAGGDDERRAGQRQRQGGQRHGRRRQWRPRPRRPGRGRAREAERRAPGPAPDATQTREESLVAVLVWFTMGIALWHFTVFLPDRFWQGIVGAFLGSVIGAMVVGLIIFEIDGQTLSNTNLATALTAIPGVIVGLGVVWLIGSRQEHLE